MTRSKANKHKKAQTERAQIGTPAGESPEEGRKRHGTECLTDACAPPDENRHRKVILNEVDEEYLEEEGEETGTGGQITGTHVKGGIPAGGTTSGGTLPEPAKSPSQGEANKGTEKVSHT